MSIPISRFNLRQFRLIEAIVKTGQLSLAAEALSITQPAASRTLSEIENLIGEPLFERHPKGLTPTPFGELVIRRAAAVMSELEGTAHDLDAFRAGSAGSVRIGTVTGPAIAYVVPAIQQLKAEVPRAEIAVEVAPSVDLVDGLFSGEFDIILSRIPPRVDPRKLHIIRGRAEKILFVTNADHPLQSHRDIQLSDLTDHTWLIQRTGMPIRAAIEQTFIDHDQEVPGDIIETASLLYTMGYLRNSDAIAVLTSEVLDMLAGTLWIRPILTSVNIVVAPYHIITLGDRVLPPLCRRALDIICDKIAVT